jgi:peroxiredoxin
MSREIAAKETAAPLALSSITKKLIADQGVERSDALFAGQIDTSTKALARRTKVLGVGDKAPHFSLSTTKGGSWSLEDYLSRGEADSLVLVFYRGTWCAYCNVYMRQLIEVQSQLSDAKATLIAVSPEAEPISADDPVNVYMRDVLSAEAPRTEATSFLVLVDQDSKVADKYGLAFEMDDGAKATLRGIGLDLEKRNAGGGWTLPVPGTFVVDRSGTIAYAHVDADYRNRSDPQKILATCRSLHKI